MTSDTKGIFINYRREEAAAHAGWLADSLSEHFGKHKIFRDIDSIEPGLDFVEAIQRAVNSAEVVVTLIGRSWLTSVDAAGRLRLQNPDDYVRMEIAAALQRNTRVLPVLIQGASMPDADELPDDLAALARRNAFELRDTSWKDDVRRLTTVLENVVGSPEEGSIEVPDLSGQNVSQADRMLSKKGLKLGNRNEAPSDTVPQGVIIKQEPVAGTEAQQGSSVHVTTSVGPASSAGWPSHVQNGKKWWLILAASVGLLVVLALVIGAVISSPSSSSAALSLRGKTLSEAYQAAQAAGYSEGIFLSGLADDYPPVKASERPKGTIIDHDVPDKSDPIWATISGGQGKVRVPDVSGMDVDTAANTLINAGLNPSGMSMSVESDGKVDVFSWDNGSPTGGKVGTTNPAAGKQVDAGSTITLTSR